MAVSQRRYPKLDIPPARRNIIATALVALAAGTITTAFSPNTNDIGSKRSLSSCGLCSGDNPLPEPERVITIDDNSLFPLNETTTCGGLQSQIDEIVANAESNTFLTNTELSVESACSLVQSLAVEQCGCPSVASTSINCTLCEDGSYPEDPSARYRFPGTNNVLDCAQLYDLAPTLNDSSVCDSLRGIGSSLCSCMAEEPEPCRLCPGSVDLGDKRKKSQVLPEGTCAELEQRAASDFLSECPAWQSTAGLYCGCFGNISNNEPLVIPDVINDASCRLCPNEPHFGVLPNVSRIVSFQSGRTTSCGMLEIESSRNSGKCVEHQTRYFEVCCVEQKEEPITASEQTASSACGFKLTLLWPIILMSIVLYSAL